MIWYRCETGNLGPMSDFYVKLAHGVQPDLLDCSPMRWWRLVAVTEAEVVVQCDLLQRAIRVDWGHGI